jgi:hypothetical protein
VDRHQLREHQSESPDSDGGVFEKRLGCCRAEEDLDESLDKHGDVRLQVLLERRSVCRYEASQRLARQKFSEHKGDAPVDWHCMAISPTAQAALLQTLTSSYLGVAT